MDSELRTIDGRSDLDGLVRVPSDHRVSLYVPFDPSPTEHHADDLRMRAAIDRFQERLGERGLPEEAIRERAETLRAMAPEPHRHPEWTRTLAWFGDDEGWALARLGDPLAERVVVAGSCAFRPLLHTLDRNPHFRVLAVSANRVAAYEGSAAGLRAIALDDVPTSLEEALGSELEGGGLSMRSERPVPGQRANAGIFHGHGGADDERAVDRERFHRVLGAALTSRWQRVELPVVIAAEERTASELRKHLELPRLLEHEVSGSPDHWSPEELHERALPIVREHVEALIEARRERFEELRGAGKSEQRLDAIVQATIAGRVARLWVEASAHEPGRVDEAHAVVAPCDDPDEDVLDALVSLVMARGGEPVVVGPGETPTQGSVCAELR